MPINTIMTPAEHLKVSRWLGRPDVAELQFDFGCPNCGHRHHRREISNHYFAFVGYALRCGWVTVHLGEWAVV